MRSSALPDPPPRPPSSRLVLLGRIVLLLIAAGGALAGLGIARRDRRLQGAAGGEYTCPMHPEVASRRPGECPICRMALERAAPVLPAAVEAPPLQYFDLARPRSFGQDVVAPAWLEREGVVAARLYRDEVAALSPAQAAVFSSAGRADASVRWDGAPAEPWDRSTVTARFTVAGLAPGIAPGAVGFVKAPGRRRELLVIPSAALLEGREGPRVLVASRDGRVVTPRAVELGRVVGGLAFVQSGLRPQERVLVRNPFFFDAERRLHPEGAVEVSP